MKFFTSESAMIIEYDLTKHDLIVFNLYHVRHSPTIRRQYLISLFVPAVIGLLVCIVIWYLAVQTSGTPLKTLLALLPLFTFVPLYVVLFPWAYRRNLRKNIDGMVREGKSRGLFTRHRLTLSEETVGEVSEYSETSTAWQAVERVVMTEEYGYIYINALAAIIVPRRAFPGTSEFEAFVQTAMRHRTNAPSAP